MKKCIQCNNNIPAEAKFCGYCGTSQVVSVEQSVSDMQAGIKSSAPQPQSAPAIEERGLTVSAAMKKCPLCAEDIRVEAVYCRYCNNYLNSSPRKDENSLSIPISFNYMTKRIIVFILLIICCIGIFVPSFYFPNLEAGKDSFNAFLGLDVISFDLKLSQVDFGAVFNDWIPMLEELGFETAPTVLSGIYILFAFLIIIVVINTILSISMFKEPIDNIRNGIVNHACFGAMNLAAIITVLAYNSMVNSFFSESFYGMADQLCKSMQTEFPGWQMLFFVLNLISMIVLVRLDKGRDKKQTADDTQSGIIDYGEYILDLRDRELNDKSVETVLRESTNLILVTSVDLAHNMIHNPFSLNELSHITCLDLSYNQISSLTSVFLVFRYLEQLDLSRNNINDSAVSDLLSNLSLVDSLHSLTELNLKNNQISNDSVERIKTALPNCKIIY